MMAIKGQLVISHIQQDFLEKFNLSLALSHDSKIVHCSNITDLINRNKPNISVSVFSVRYCSRKLQLRFLHTSLHIPNKTLASSSRCDDLGFSHCVGSYLRDLTEVLRDAPAPHHTRILR